MIINKKLEILYDKLINKKFQIIIMKQVNTILKISFILFIMALVPLTLKAQDSKILGGLGLSYSSNISSIGILAKGVYLINDTWEGAGSFTYLFESNFTKWSMLDMDGHYVFTSDGSKMVYGLAGLNFTFWKIKLASEYGAFFGDSDISGSEVGLNLGAGGRFALTDQIQLVGEAKYTLGGFNFFTLGAGVLYHF